MATSYQLPPEMMVGHCAICAVSFQYSKTLTRPPKTCGALRCGREAGEPWAREEVAT